MNRHTDYQTYHKQNSTQQSHGDGEYSRVDSREREEYREHHDSQQESKERRSYDEIRASRARRSERRDDQETYKEHIYNFFHDVILKWHLIVFCAVLFAVAGDTFHTLTYKPTYTTSASIIIKQNVYDNEASESMSDIASALGYVLSSDVFMNQIKGEMKVKELEGTYNVSHMDGTNILKIKAQASSPKVSYRMMYYMQKKYKNVMKYVVGDTTLRVIDQAQVPLSPDNQVNHKRNLLLYGLIGALVMTAFLVFQSAMRDTIKCQSDVKDKLQVRLMADIATESKWYLNGLKLMKKRGLLITQLSTSFNFVETFKRLGTRFEAEAKKNGWKKIMINSTWEDEGKTSVITNLAIQLAQMNRRVLLVDTDFGKPALQKILQVEPEFGLEEALRGEKAFSDIIYHDRLRKLDCVFVKKVISDATSLLEDDGLTFCLDTVKDNYDYILLDTPPASYLGMSLIVAQHADAVALVTRQNFAPTVLVNRTIERYIGQETPVMGVVLNRSMHRFGRVSRSYR